MASKRNSYGDATEHFSIPLDQNIRLMDCKKLNYEEERIKSFASWPVHFPVDPSRLAKAGFYYTGIADDVVCFSCQGHVRNWNYGDIVLKKHSDLYPNCDFIKNRSNNVPLLKTSLKCDSQLLGIENGNQSIHCSQSIDFDKMKSESERLKTFEKWPLSFISASDLAHAGFFYTGTDCKAQCPYCKGIISNWKFDSSPIQEHFKQFPWCDYLSENILPVKNGHSWFQSSSQDVCGNMIKQDASSPKNIAPCTKLISDKLQQANLEDLGVHVHKGPMHPQHASLTARLRSFETWPTFSPVSKEDLAAAGFFYIGIGDRTICFHCNGGLCTWEKGDDPWVEHARWFSTCDFLRLNKGQDFIKSCTIKKLSMLKESSPKDGVITGAKEPILKKVDEAMKSNLIKYVLETELFPSYIVRAALLLEIKQTGNVFTNLDDLCVAASCLKEEMEKQTFEVAPVQAESLNINENSSDSCSKADDSSLADNSVCTISPKSQDSHSEITCLKTGKSAYILAGNSEKADSLDEDDLREQCICKICMDKEVGVVFLPCGHLPACTICAPALKQCPMCRKSIQATVRVYLN